MVSATRTAHSHSILDDLLSFTGPGSIDRVKGVLKADIESLGVQPRFSDAGARCPQRSKGGSGCTHDAWHRSGSR
jgi:hypothetical protein